MTFEEDNWPGNVRLYGWSLVKANNGCSRGQEDQVRQGQIGHEYKGRLLLTVDIVVTPEPAAQAASKNRTTTKLCK